MLRLSVVLVAYQMERELPRTMRSLSPTYQNLSRDQYEVIIVDNGSTPPVSGRDFLDLGLDLTVLRMEAPTRSPVPAINRGIEAARGNLIGAFIDGARMASPGMLNMAIRASRLSDRPVIATLAFHLGPDVQMRSVRAGYNQAMEDALLNSIGWPSDGYRLFEVAALAGSSGGGWFAPMNESNGLFSTKEIWRQLGGFDPGFVTPGGGLCNLDVYRRACELPGSDLIILLGEGTFHQVHGGVATNLPKPPLAEFVGEYARLRGVPFAPPSVRPTFLGTAPAQTLPSIEYSAIHCQPHAAPRPRYIPPGALTVKDRCYATAAPPSLLESIQRGVLNTRYRRVPCLKSPFDLVLYARLIETLRPLTIIEIGGNRGGSALWFADQMNFERPGGRVVSVDIDPRFAFTDERIDVVKGDGRALGSILSAEYLESLQRPWLVVEDSAHTQEVTRAVIDFFAPRLRSGEYLVVEDGVVAFLPGEQYRSYDQGPNRAVASYMVENPATFEVDVELCDFFGFNVTYNPNGWLRRT